MIELIFGFIFEFFGELLIQFILEIGLEFEFNSISKVFQRKDEANPIYVISGLLILGSLLGLISAWVFPNRIFTRVNMPGIIIIVSSICAGLVMQLFGSRRIGHGKNASYLASFWGGATFAFVFLLVRWLIIR